ncbi:hypothetical protein HHK36_025068 [Tetracentron sinense]|uniref:Retrotransposon Copia-like N-terminal domain-containing protein n=1 Tax=Tetracentron sinense TaxID=13715 RepID=A0A835D595_TETSI|nr:hypothetical protein HHK36_025068 [Tetracentron sinense]
MSTVFNDTPTKEPTNEEPHGIPPHPSSHSLPSLNLSNLTNFLTVKFNGMNYLVWRNQVHPILISQDLFRFVNGSQPPPPPPPHHPFFPLATSTQISLSRKDMTIMLLVASIPRSPTTYWPKRSALIAQRPYGITLQPPSPNSIKLARCNCPFNSSPYTKIRSHMWMTENLVLLFETVHLDNEKILKALICSKDDLQQG